jgi:hypothetical protein
MARQVSLEETKLDTRNQRPDEGPTSHPPNTNRKYYCLSQLTPPLFNGDSHLYSS